MSHIMIFLRAAYCAVRFIFRLALLFFSVPPIFFVRLFIFCCCFVPLRKLSNFATSDESQSPHLQFTNIFLQLHRLCTLLGYHRQGTKPDYKKDLWLLTRHYNQYSVFLYARSLSLSLDSFFNTIQSNSRRGGTMDPSLRCLRCCCFSCCCCCLSSCKSLTNLAE